MRITIKLFAVLRDRAGVSDWAIELPAGATAGTAAEAVRARFPAIADLTAKAALAVNFEYATADVALKDGDEVALIPPVSGG
jgi:molybdopterin synthase catalytic subunit